MGSKSYLFLKTDKSALKQNVYSMCCITNYRVIVLKMRDQFSHLFLRQFNCRPERRLGAVGCLTCALMSSRPGGTFALQHQSERGGGGAVVLLGSRHMTAYGT